MTTIDRPSHERSSIDRPPVPSARELEQGVEPVEPVFRALDGTWGTGRDAEEEIPGVGDRLRAFLKDMDPRGATGGHSMRPIAVFSLAGMLQGVAGSTLATSFARIRDDLFISDDTLIIAGSVGGILGAIAGPLFGFLADRVSRVKLGVIGALLYAALTYFIGAQASTFALITANIGHRLFSTGPTGLWGSIVHLPLLADYYPPEVRGRAYALPSVIGSTFAVLSYLVGGFVSETFGWQTSLKVTGVIAAFAAVGYLTLKEPTRGHWDRLRLGASELTARRAARPPSISESWRAAASVRTLRRIWYADALLSAGGVVLTPLLLIIYSRNFGASPLLIGAIASAQQVLTTVAIAIGGTLVDRYLTTRPGRIMQFLGMAYMFNMTTLLVLGLITNRWVALVILLIQPFASQIPERGRDVLMSQVIPARFRAFGVQTRQIFSLVGLLVVPIAVGIAEGDAISAAFTISAPAVFIGALMYITANNDVAKDIESARLAVLAEEEMVSSFESDTRKLLICRKVDVHYDSVQVLFNVDFEIDEGELVALLGTNGAGKSTLLRAISGLSEASGGAIFLDGRDITHTPPHELAQFGVVQMPGGKGVFPTLTVAENLKSAAWLDRDEYEARLAGVLDLFPRLRERMDTAAGNLSGGEQQMVALGQALLMKPKLLLIDELSLGLAPAIVEELLRAVEAIRDSGTTIILVEQSVNIALTVADRAVFMEKGEVRFSGSTEELRRRPDILRSVYLRGSTGGRAVAAPRRFSTGADQAVVLDVDGIHVSYGGVIALQGASLRVVAGEIVGLIGPNGAGKTTLFDAISGFVEPQEGTVRIVGKDATWLPPDRRARLGLGRSFQDARLFGSLTVREAIQVAMERQAKASRSAALSALWLPPVREAEKRLRSRADGLIEMLGLQDFRSKFVSELSTGSRRIVDLACVMASDPEILLLDEPSSGIAQAEAEELGPVLERVRRETGCGMVVIEHDMRLLTSVADRMVGMVLGRTIVEGSVETVTEHPEMVEAYLGTSERVLARSGDVAPSAAAAPPRRRRSTS